MMPAKHGVALKGAFAGPLLLPRTCRLAGIGRIPAWERIGAEGVYAAEAVAEGARAVAVVSAKGAEFAADGWKCVRLPLVPRHRVWRLRDRESAREWSRQPHAARPSVEALTRAGKL